MRLGKSIVGEAFQVFGDLSSHRLEHAAVDHPRSQLLENAMQLLDFANVSHGAAQLVGLRGGIATERHGDRHRLLLENRDPLGALENRLEIGVRVSHRLQSATARGVRMYELRLDWTG